MTKIADKTKYPECDKWAEVVDDARVVHAFMDFVNCKGYQLAEWNEDDERLASIHTSIEKLLYEMYEIDAEKLEKERSDMVANL